MSTRSCLTYAVAHEMSSVVLSISLALIAMVAIAGLFSMWKRKGNYAPSNRVCFDGLGCFDNDYRWRTRVIPVPQPQPPDLNPTIVFFFSRQNKEVPYRIATHPIIQFGEIPFDGQRPTLLVVHGFMRNASSPWMQKLKDFYLDAIDANVLLTDWSVGAFGNYLQTISNTRVVGRALTNLVKFLIEKKNLKPERVHLVGHSLGAHICSYVAKEIPKIGRLTALDPAQPGYEISDPITRLDKSDATFVEVVHTDAKPFVPNLGLGMIAPHGHVDFYFNGGFHQPGCLVPDELPVVSDMSDLKRFPLEYPYRLISCSHERSHEYLVEAYNTSSNCVFWGHKVKPSDVARFITEGTAGGFLSNLNNRWDICTLEECIPFGLNAINSRLRGIVVVKTSFEPPYCLPEPWGYSNGLNIGK